MAAESRASTRLLVAAASAGLLASLLAYWRRRGKHVPCGLLITGTGCSAGVPIMRCAFGNADPACFACGPATRNGPSDPNWRGNVGCVIRFADASGTLRHIAIDVGKTFRENALRWFTRHRVGAIDCVVLTHEHADAALGLDDLRSLQGFDSVTRLPTTPPIPVHCDRRSLAKLRRALPYLFPQPQADPTPAAPFDPLRCACCDELDVEDAELRRSAQVTDSSPSGGGAPVRRFLPQFAWQEFDADGSPFDAIGLSVLPLPVLHGRDYVCFGFGFGPPGSRVAWISDYTALLPHTEAVLDAWAAEPDGIALLVLDAIKTAPATPVRRAGFGNLSQ